MKTVLTGKADSVRAGGSRVGFSVTPPWSAVPVSSASPSNSAAGSRAHGPAIALCCTVIVRMRLHRPTIDYVARRTAEGLSKRDIIRCLKRYLARQIHCRVMADHRARQAPPTPWKPTLHL